MMAAERTVAVRKAFKEDLLRNIMLSHDQGKGSELFRSGTCRCPNAEARDASDGPVKFHDPLATAWDITGASCRLFGWKRASTLSGQFERHLHKRKRHPDFNRDATVESMLTVHACNDAPGTTFNGHLTMLMAIPVWPSVSRTFGRTVTSA